MPAGVTLKQITEGSASAIWVLDTADSPWKWTGTTWEKRLGTVHQISVGSDGTLWATNPPDSKRVLRGDGLKWNTDLSTGMVTVSVGSANNIWGSTPPQRDGPVHGARRASPWGLPPEFLTAVRPVGPM